MDVVYVLSESGIEHHAIVAIYASRAEAEREAAYCGAMQKRATRSGLQHDYRVTEHRLGESNAGLLVRLDAANRPKLTDFFAVNYSDPPRQFGEVDHYDTAWPNGVCKAVLARTVEDAVRFAQSSPQRAEGRA